MDELQPETIKLDRAAMIAEAHAWGKAFVRRSADWRRPSFETNWVRWQRNADSTYDPELAQKKEGWQSRAFWPLTAAHRENAQSQLFKTEVGPRPPVDVKPRKGIVPQGVPGADQSENIRDLYLREREKSEYEINRNLVLEDKTTYGSGFAQVYFDTDFQDRVVQKPIYEEVQMPWVDGGASITRRMLGKPEVVGYEPVVQAQVIYRGVRFRHISIWDVFPDPQSLKIAGSPIAIRYRTTYEAIVAGAKEGPDGSPGHVLPEAVVALKTVASNESVPTDKQAVQADRGISNANVERTEQGKILECFEVQARLPKKWVLINGEPIDDPEALMPARLRFHEQCVVSIFPSEAYDGEPDIYKDDYMPVAGQFYGRGIPEMVKDNQAVINELTNQTLDSGTVSLLNVYAVIEKSVVNPKDFTLGPGSVIRFKSKDGLANIDQLFKKIDMGSIDRNSVLLINEQERSAEQRTSVTATTLGTEDNRDMTLGAQKIQQGVTGVKLAYLGMLSEFDFQRKIFRAYLKNIYANYQPQDYALALGPERAATIVPVSPEQFENAYQYTPLGIFEMENKNQRQAGLANWAAQFAQYPWANVVENAKEQARILEIDSDKMILPEAEAIQITVKAQQMAQGMAQQMVAERDAKTNAMNAAKAEKSEVEK